MRKIFILTIGLMMSFVSLANNTEAILVTPPAPIFSDQERQHELVKRRNAVLAQMLPNSLLILFSAKPRNYAGDVDFFYRQENDHFYLTNLLQKGSALILEKRDGISNEYLFLPKRDSARETWNGKMYSNEEAQKISGVKTIIDAQEFDTFLNFLKEKKEFISKSDVKIGNKIENVYLLLPDDVSDEEGMAEYNQEAAYAGVLSNYRVINARPVFDQLRLIKSPLEIALLQHAIDITTEAQMRSMAMVKQANWEYEVQAEVEYTFRRRNADYWGYPSIVGCGANATTLHYIESQGAITNGSLLLMDVGAEFDHYTADVTRTFPVNGKFSKEQADIYQIVYDAQEAAAKMIKPGASFRDASRAADAVIRDGLFKLGLTTDKSSGQHRIWFMHGWGHWLGMNVHDVGAYDTPLKAGMVTTNEPGIYIREDALKNLPDTAENREFIRKVKPAFEKYKNIGVRIEDDMLVTETGVKWLTEKLPRKIVDIESFMSKASAEIRRTAAIEKSQSVRNDRLGFVEQLTRPSWLN